MKIKYWLLLTYVLVMLLPLGALYGLYVTINQYYEQQNMKHYFEQLNSVQVISSHLQEPVLYTNEAGGQKIAHLSNEQTLITLYAPNGKVLYSSNPFSIANTFEDEQTLYRDLYTLQQTYNSFVYKEPVYMNGEVVGLYKITLARTQWTERVGNVARLTTVGVIVFILLLIGVIYWLLQRKLNRPLKQLMEQMELFAKGHEMKPLAVRRDEIGELTESFQSMQREILQNRNQLDEEQRQKQFMMASLSHDLKTPLTVIQAYAESIRSEQLTAKEYLQYTATIERKSVEMKQMLDDLTMFSLLQSSTYELTLVQVEAEEFIEMAFSDYAAISKEKGFQMDIQMQLSKYMYVDPNQLQRVFDNIISNAWNYAKQQSVIHIAAFDAKNAAEFIFNEQIEHSTGTYIVIRNEALPLTEAQCKQMFEPMHQLDEARRTIGQRGAGLGLSIAKQIVSKHFGEITATYKDGQVTFKIWLPEEEIR